MTSFTVTFKYDYRTNVDEKIGDNVNTEIIYERDSVTETLEFKMSDVKSYVLSRDLREDIRPISQNNRTSSIKKASEARVTWKYWVDNGFKRVK